MPPRRSRQHPDAGDRRNPPACDIVPMPKLEPSLYMDASRWQGPIRCSGRTRLQFYIRPVRAGWCLLALMESADPRLILPLGFLPLGLFRLGGSRSDLFAITLRRTLRNLLA